MSHDRFAPRDSERAFDDEYRLLIESVEEYAIFLLDPHGRVASWNAGAERIKGYRRSEIVGQSFAVFFPPEDIAAGKPERELELASEHGSYGEEGWRIRKNGERFWASMLLTALRDNTGELRGFGKVTRDLSERLEAENIARELIREQSARQAAEKAEDALRESEHRYRALSRRLEVVLEGVSDGITVQEHDGRVVYANSAAARLCGMHSAADLINLAGEQVRAPFDVFDEHGHPFSPELLPGRLALLGQNPGPALMRIRERTSGRTWWAQVRATLVRDPERHADLVVNIWHDVTYRQRQLEASRYLASVTAALSNTLEHQNIARVVADLLVPQLADWCVIDVLEADHLLPGTVAHIDPAKIAVALGIRQRYPERTDGDLWQVLRTGVSRIYPNITPEMVDASAVDEEHRVLLRNVGLHSVIIVPLRANDRVLGAITLISAESGRTYHQDDLAVAEELGRRSGIAIDNARLYREAQRAIQLRDEFLSIAGHELRTPLTALNLQLQGVLVAAQRGAALHDTAKFADRLNKALGQSHRLERLIRELLDVARVSSGRLSLHREPTDLGRIAEEVVERHGGELLRCGSVASVHISGDTQGQWDASRLDQVVTNLLGNAIKYGQGSPIVLHVTGQDTRVVLTITDGGIGVAEVDRGRIFDRFERAVSDRNYGGLGLGLWIVREIARAHGGEVRLGSHRGKGATFVFELPRFDEAAS